ncbi:MAG TPA: YIP1 family protein [Vicinamibacterales bacterium]|nr:YIP1 family protein [Vicinamibacterales bacterium]
MHRVTAVLVHPRSTMAEVVRHPAFLATWVVVLLAVAVCGGLLLSTPVGRQALVDERVRVTEALGGRVNDAEYAGLQADLPRSVYVTSGGRLLLTPPVTMLVAAGLLLLARLDGARISYATALAITVHATVVLALQQIVATPLHYAAESLTSPTNVAGLLRVFDEGTWPARLFGTIDVFGLWWMWLLSVGLAAATARPARRYLWRLLAVYVGVAALVAAVFAVLGRGTI